MDVICSQKNFFKNPYKLPLNELRLEVNIVTRKKKVPTNQDLEDIKDNLYKNYEVQVEKKAALDAYWIQKEHSYTEYQPYYSEIPEEENILFIEKNKLFIENLKFLLQCSFHQFWNYVLFEPRIKHILKSFILNPLHVHELKHLSEEYLSVYNDLYFKVASVYLRMLTFKESNIEFLNEDFAMKVLETSKLISYVEIINLFALYSKTNLKLINQLHDLFFTAKLRSEYTKELTKIFNHSLLVFEMIGGQVCGFEDDAVVLPVGVRPKPYQFDPYWLEEVTGYLLDMATTLNAFLSNCSSAIDIALKLGLPYRLTYFYNRLYPGIYQMMYDRANLPTNWLDIKSRIMDNIASSRLEFVEVFHIFIVKLIDAIIQSLGDNEKQDGYLEEYLSLMSAALEDEFFTFDYHNTHQIDIQLQTLSDFHPQMDHMRTNYILECLSTLPTLESVKNMKVENVPEMNFALPESAYTSTSEINTDKTQYSEAEILDLTKTVVDALPYLGDGFIRECLKTYNYNTVKVISTILDENLPLDLTNIPRDLVYVPPESEPEQPILAYKGKKPGYKDATQLLNDKSEIKEVKEFVLKASNASFDIYDDEYDDRYDDEPILRFYDKTDESNMYDPMGNKFEGYELVSDPSSSESEEQETAMSKPTNAFCEDPAILRAKREANRNHRGRKVDLVGKAKGQGQDKSVLQNREKKNVHKSSKANHSRKSGAQWKRNKGMIPS